MDHARTAAAAPEETSNAILSSQGLTAGFCGGERAVKCV